MAKLDMIQDSGVTITSTSCNDGDWDTAYSTSFNHGYGGAHQNISLTCDATWTTERTIFQIDYRISTGAGEAESSCDWTVSLRVNGIWTQVDSGDASGTNVTSTTGGQKTLAGSWDRVTGMRLYGHAFGDGDVPNGTVSLYEMQAWYRSFSYAGIV